MLTCSLSSSQVILDPDDDDLVKTEPVDGLQQLSKAEELPHDGDDDGGGCDDNIGDVTNDDNDVDNKEALHQQLGFDTHHQGGEEGGGGAYDDMLIAGPEDGGAHNLPGGSGYQEVT